MGLATGLTRRQFVSGGAAAGAAVLASNDLIARALAAPPALREARGHRARGDPDPGEPLVRPLLRLLPRRPGLRRRPRPATGRRQRLDVFAQPGYPAATTDHLYPFHLDSYDNGECTNDINHSWGPQHAYWHGGRWTASSPGTWPSTARPTGPLTMGYYTRRTCRSTTRWPTRSRSATTTTAR